MVFNSKPIKNLKKIPCWCSDFNYLCLLTENMLNESKKTCTFLENMLKESNQQPTTFL